MKNLRYLLAAAILLSMPGCSQQFEGSGHSSINDYQRLNQIKEGVTTREQVASLLGNAVDRNIRETWKKSRNAQGEEVWQFNYIEGDSTSGFVDHSQITKLLITFDQSGIVKSKERTVKSRSSGTMDIFRDDFSLIPYKEELPF